MEWTTPTECIQNDAEVHLIQMIKFSTDTTRQTVHVPTTETLKGQWELGENLYNELRHSIPSTWEYVL